MQPTYGRKLKKNEHFQISENLEKINDTSKDGLFNQGCKCMGDEKCPFSVVRYSHSTVSTSHIRIIDCILTKKVFN